ncbi:MAG TPA: hypothetical protein VMR25_16805, partial [Planctomycetaceae bacterium]|nr:hypothetical protein [Planctomycetaceae bacterium]
GELVLDTPAPGKATSTGAAKPSAPSKSIPAAQEKTGKKQSMNDQRDNDNLLALAVDDTKSESKTGAKPAEAAKSTVAAPAQPPAKTRATKAADKTKPVTPAKPAPPSKPAPKADPKAEYEKALSQYKKDVERYENDKSEYEKKLKKGQDKVKELNDRFGPWYYVISAESFENLRLTRAGLLKPKEAPGAKKDVSGPGNPPIGFPTR